MGQLSAAGLTTSNRSGTQDDQACLGQARSRLAEPRPGSSEPLSGHAFLVVGQRAECPQHSARLAFAHGPAP